MTPITFTEEEAHEPWHPHNNAIIINLRITRRKVYCILIDNKSSLDIPFKSTLNRINLVGASIKPTKSTLYGFTGESVDVEGILSLPVELSTCPCQHIQTVHFVVVDFPSVYNMSIGCLTLNAIQAIVSTYHLLAKFPTVGGIGVLKGQQVELRDLNEEAGRPFNLNRVNSMLIRSVEVGSKEIEESSEPRRPCPRLSMTSSLAMTSFKSLDTMTLQALGSTAL